MSDKPWTTTKIKPQAGLICEACRRELVTRVVTLSEEWTGQPFRVCAGCYSRLMSFILRPIEWFNLAALHSTSRYHLHDDFYDENGASHTLLHQHSDGAEQIRQNPAPTLAEAGRDLERLLDYAYSRWHLEPDVIAALRTHDSQQLLDALRRRVEASGDTGLEARSLQICEVIGRSCADWVRQLWNSPHAPWMLGSLAHAASRCLPLEEGLVRVQSALEQRHGERFHHEATALAYFRDERVLDWLEREFTQAAQTVADSWGRLAAASQLSWPRVQKWLESGRPLSLIALDALIACFRYDTILLKNWAPKLIAPPSRREAIKVLNAYVLRDDVPRVQRAVSHIAENWDSLIAAS